MNYLENISYIHSDSNADGLARKDALIRQAADEDTRRGELFEKTVHPDNDLIRGFGWTALAAMTGGIAAGRFENAAPMYPATEKQIRALGYTPLNYLAKPEEINDAINETAILGYGNVRAT